MLTWFYALIYSEGFGQFSTAVKAKNFKAAENILESRYPGCVIVELDI